MRRWIVPILAGSLSGLAAYAAVPGLVSRYVMAKAVDRVAARGGFNTMSHGKLATPENQTIVRPSPDLAYSTCPFDVSQGPVLVSVVPPSGRYSSLSVFDANTDVAFVRNDVQAGGKPYKVLLVRNNVKIALPDGVNDLVRLNDDRGIALIRILLSSPAEIGQLEAIRAQSNCAPLSRAQP